MAEWRQFANKQKEKRGKGKNARKEKNDAGSEITVQRMSSDVSGKQQKYSRIGPREYVLFDCEDLTIDNIKAACQKHFAKRVERDMVCNVLAGERGPSCSKMSQIPDLKIFYVRFIKNDFATVDDYEDIDDAKYQVKRKREDSAIKKRPASACSPKKEDVRVREYPKSLSVVEMLRLGKVISKKSSTVIHIYQFDLQHMEWTTVPSDVEFLIETEYFASGGFRKAFKAKSVTKGYMDKTWVVKHYLEKALQDIEATGQTPEEHTRKVVQGHTLAMNFAKQLKERVIQEHLDVECGPVFEYRKIFMGKTDNDEFVTVEEYIEGDFIKYINNNGQLYGEDSEVCKKAESLAHFSYEKSKGRLMLLDIQGSGHTLYDPEFASRQIMDDAGNVQFCTGNLSMVAIDNFFSEHSCNNFCTILNLKVKSK